MSTPVLVVSWVHKNKIVFVCLVKFQNIRKKISGPLLDRIDIHLDVPAVEMEKLTGEYQTEDSQTVRSRVEKIREIQRKRFAGTKIHTNSEMSNAQIKQFCVVSTEGVELLKLAISKMHLSARSYHRILKLSRTIADLAGSDNIEAEHVAEALQYRAREEG